MVVVRIHRCCILIPTLLLCAGVVRSNASAEDDAIVQLRASIERFGDVEIRATISYTISSTLNQRSMAIAARPQVRSKALLLYRSSASRALVSWKEEQESSGAMVRTQIDSVLYKNGDILHIQAALDPNLVQVDGVNDDLGLMLYSKRLAGKQEIDRKGMLGRIGDSAALYGYIGYEPLANYLNGSTNFEVHRDGGGPKVTSVSRYGELTMILDPEHGFLPNAFRVTRRGADLHNGRRIDEIDMKGGKGIWPPGGVESITWEAKNARLGFSKDAPYIKEITIEQRVKSTSGVVVTITTNARITSIAFSPNLPDDYFNTDIKAPAGYDVTVAGASHLPYEWDGTKPVPRVVRGDTFLGRLSEKRGVTLMLLVINTAFLLALTWFLFQKYRRQQV